MNAQQIFSYLLRQIETSELNYSITKTPFSASISIKSSFAKRYQHLTDRSTEKLRQHDVSTSHTRITATATLETENLEIKATIKSLEKTVTRQKEDLKDKFVEIKEMKKMSDDQVSEFRAELLKVKSERNKLQAKLKTLEDDNEKLKEESNIVKTEAKEALKDLANKKNIQINEVKSLEKDKEALEKLVSRLKQTSDKEPVSLKFKCELCRLEFDDMTSLKAHTRAEHTKDQHSQNEAKSECKSKSNRFSEYLCYYCRKRINSEKDLEEHKPVCYGIKDFAAYPCEKCGAQCKDNNALGRHRTVYHGLATFSEEHETELFWCDSCPLNYRVYETLEDHMKSCHWNVG